MKLYLLALSGNVRKVSGEGDLPSVSQMFWVIAMDAAQATPRDD